MAFRAPTRPRVVGFPGEQSVRELSAVELLKPHDGAIRPEQRAVDAWLSTTPTPSCPSSRRSKVVERGRAEQVLRSNLLRHARDEDAEGHGPAKAAFQNCEATLARTTRRPNFGSGRSSTGMSGRAPFLELAERLDHRSVAVHFATDFLFETTVCESDLLGGGQLCVST